MIETPKKSREYVGIAEVIDNVMNHLATDDIRGKGKIFINWEKIVGVELAKHAKPYRVRGKTLTILVDSSCWLYELEQNYRPFLLQNINKIIGENVITVIKMKVGEI